MKGLLLTLFILSTSVTYAKQKAQIAILIDTSGSMQGLINQVRDGLWSTLNSLDSLTKNGEASDVELALYEYGSGSVSAEAKFIRQLVPLTTDHTLIAEKLFATKATGSEELVGQVLTQAGNDLSWSMDSQDFKSIVLAGNETIFQGMVNPVDAAEALGLKAIGLNTIFAGEKTSHLDREGESLSSAGLDGTLNIDQNRVEAHIDSPFDDEIIETTIAMNKTYLPFGQYGETEYRRMLDVDRNVRNSGRGSYIGWGSYRTGGFGQRTTASWDLITAFRLGSLDLTKIPDSKLPLVLRGLSLADKLGYIQKVNAQRTALESKLTELRSKRTLYVESVRAEQNQNEQENFSAAIRKLISKQLEAQGFSL
jgi:hypothetical protein